MVLEENIESVENIPQETPTIIKNEEERHQCEIALAAYFKAERRKFISGHALDDWLEAEHDIMGNP